MTVFIFAEIYKKAWAKQAIDTFDKCDFRWVLKFWSDFSIRVPGRKSGDNSESSQNLNNLYGPQAILLVNFEKKKLPVVFVWVSKF